LFSTVLSDHSNILFENKLKDQQGYNTLFQANFYGGGGVGIGDIDNDGLQDIYFCGNQVADKIYLNQGGLRFRDISESSGIVEDDGWSTSVLMGDINNDGYLDIYVTREMYGDSPERMQNKLYLNNGNQTFTEVAEAWGVDNQQRSRGGTFFDYDNDGDLDLYLLNTPPNPGPLVDIAIEELLMDPYTSVLYQNQGDHFVEVTAEAGLIYPGFPNSVVATDLNDDGYQDLYVTHDFTISDCMYINNGDGTFTNRVIDMTGHISFGSMGVDAADINNDGLPDLLVTDMSAEDNYRIKANMGGMNPEAFWAVVDRGGHHQYMYNTLQLNTGFDRFSDIAQLAGLATTDWSWSSFFADFDNDGFKDVFVSNGILRDIRNTDALKQLSKKINQQARPVAIGSQSVNTSFELDQSELDEMLDLFPSEKLLNYVLRNNGDYTFSKKMEDWGITQKTFSNGSAYGDLDNDGDLDLVINNINDLATVLENHADQRDAHYLRVRLTNQTTNASPLGAKIWLETSDGVQYFELTGTRGMYSSSEPIAHFGLAKDTEVNQLKVKWPDGKEYVQTNPEINELLVVDYQSAKVASGSEYKNEKPLFEEVTEQLNPGMVHIENDFDDYDLQVLLPHKMSTYGPGMAVGDVNDDGNDDVYLGGAAGHAGQLYLQTNEGKFMGASKTTFESDSPAEDVGAAFFDVDGDGDLDLYVVSGGNEYQVESENYRDRIYLNDGAGKFTKSLNALPDLRVSGSKVKPYDFDGDGDLDVLVTGHHIPGDYPSPATSHLLLNDGEKFQDVTSQLAPDLIKIGLINDALWVDVDGDQLKDLVLAGEWTPIIVLRNNGQVFENVTVDLGLESATGWWFGLAAEDVDNDGDMDLVAGNLGQNYKYKASITEPFKVYYSDFDLNGSKDIVLAYYNFGGLFPVRGRSCSSEQVPQLSDKFKTYDLFAQSGIETVYGAENLEQALQYQANTFASACFLNEGDGGFRQIDLPPQAQFSSVNSLLIRDLTGDKVPDLVIAGNLLNSEVETPRNDAGYSLILRGQGNGQFIPIRPQRSGLFMPMEVKFLSELSGVSGHYLIAGINDKPMQLFRSVEAVLE